MVKLFSARPVPVPKGSPTPFKRKAIVIRIDENVTSAMTSAAHHMPVMLAEATERSAEAVVKHIRQAFLAGQAGKWRPLTLFTIKHKKTKNPLPLFDTGQLQTAVMTMRPSAQKAGNTFIVQMGEVDWPRSPRGNFPYVFAHEFGIPLSRFKFFGKPAVATARSAGLPRRGFIREGLVAAGPEISQNFGGSIGVIRAILTKADPSVGVQVTRIGNEPGLGAFRVFTATFFLFMFLPPTIILSYIGLASDIISLLKFNFTGATAALYVRSYALGQFGLTPKTRRRQIRRRIYANQYG